MTSRLYYSIWNKLKSLPHQDARDVGVSISAPRVLHKRIVKAVKKEKWLDVGQKILLSPREAMLTHSRENSILTFYLTYTVIKEDFE